MAPPPPPTEYSWAPFINDKNYKELDFLNIIDFLLVEYDKDDDIDTPPQTDIYLDDRYNFECCIPPVEIYRDMIDEYCLGVGYKRNIYFKLIKDLLKLPKDILGYIKRRIKKS